MVRPASQGPGGPSQPVGAFNLGSKRGTSATKVPDLRGEDSQG